MNPYLVDVGEGPAGLGHHGADGGHGTDTHDLGVAPGDAVTDDPGRKKVYLVRKKSQQ